MPRVGLLHQPVQPTGPPPQGGELGSRPARHQGRDRDRQRDGDERDRGEQRRDPEHHAEGSGHGEDGGHELAEPVLQGGGEVVEVVGDPAEDVAVRVAVEVAQRQPGQFLLHRLAQPVDGALGDACHDVGLRPAERRRSAGRADAARPSTRPSRVRSTPTPGTMFIGASMSASWPWPWARSSAMACAFVTPAGSRWPTKPSNRILVAWPRILGPATGGPAETDGRAGSPPRDRPAGRAAAGTMPAVGLATLPSLMPPLPRRVGRRRSPGRARSRRAAARGSRSRRPARRRAR